MSVVILIHRERSPHHIWVPAAPAAKWGLPGGPSESAPQRGGPSAREGPTWRSLVLGRRPAVRPGQPPPSPSGQGYCRACPLLRRRLPYECASFQSGWRDLGGTGSHSGCRVCADRGTDETGRFPPTVGRPREPGGGARARAAWGCFCGEGRALRVPANGEGTLWRDSQV